MRNLDQCRGQSLTIQYRHELGLKEFLERLLNDQYIIFHGTPATNNEWSDDSIRKINDKKVLKEFANITEIMDLLRQKVHSQTFL